MDSSTLLLTVAVAAIVLILIGGVLGWIFAGRQRTKRLRQQFGSEYDRVISEVGGKREAEDELQARQKRVESLDIQPLSPEETDRFVKEWQTIQARFVEEPAVAVRKANQLITEVMRRRGYPMADFDQELHQNIVVVSAGVVRNYRAARAIVQKNGQQEISTEELRQAMVHYRALFADLVGVQEIEKRKRSEI